VDLEKLKNAANDPIGALKARSKESGRPLGLAFSSYFPLEVLDAFDLEGAWLPPVPRPDYPDGEAVLQAFVCNCVRSSADIILHGDLPVGLVAATTGCDSRLALATVLRTAGVGAPVVMLRLPVTVGNPLAVEQGSRALAGFCDETRAALGRDLDLEVLKKARDIREKGRELLTGLFENMGDGGLPASSVYTAAVAAQVMDPGDLIKALEEAPRADKAPVNGIRCMLSGSSIPSPRIVEGLEAIGVKVVADDTCTGTRAACRRTVKGVDDPVRAIGASLINRPLHGPTMLEDGHARIQQIVDTAVRRRAQAVIMLHYKFCDPHAFEAPGLTEALERAGVRSIVLEADREPGLTARDRTRVETLLEAIG